MHVALRPALLLWATELRPLPLHPLMTAADNVPPVRAAAPIVSSAPKATGSQLVPKVDEELLAQVSQSVTTSLRAGNTWPTLTLSVWVVRDPALRNRVACESCSACYPTLALSIYPR